MSGQKQWQKKLNEELKHITFNENEKVFARIQQSTQGGKLSQLWQKEIEIPLLPVMGALFGLFLIVSLQFSVDSKASYSADEIVEINGNMYWKSKVKDMIAYDEN